MQQVVAIQKQKYLRMIDMIDLLQKFKIVSFLFHIISDDVMEYDMI